MAEILRALNIVIVENHEDTLFYLTRFLEACGHRVVSVTTMKDALDHLAGVRPDLLISDIGLPDGDGWLLMNSLKHPKPFSVAISGYGAHADHRRSLEAGFSHHLVKPFDPAELETILGEAESLKFRAY
jgi:two-component system CheB/CheR fusion protein